MDKTNKGVRLIGALHNIQLAQRGVSSTMAFLHKHLYERDCVETIIDCQLSEVQKKIRLLKNFNHNKEVWSINSALDIKARKMRTANFDQQLEIDVDANAVLQIGSEFSTLENKQLKTYPKFSYHDDNLFRYFKSRSDGLSTKKKNGLLEKYQNAFSYEKNIYDGLDGIFCMSESLRVVFIEQFCQPEDKVHNIGFGANIDIQAIDVSHKKYDQQTLLIIAKDSFREKGGIVLLDAFKTVRKVFSEARLIVVGQEELEKVDGVEWVGYLDKNRPEDLEKFKSIIAASTLYVMPSFVEAAGSAFLEAMAYGLPCIGAEQGASIEIIRGNDCGALVSGTNPKDLASYIIELLENEEELRRLGNNARLAIDDKYNWDVVCDKALVNIASLL